MDDGRGWAIKKKGRGEGKEGWVGGGGNKREKEKL